MSKSVKRRNMEKLVKSFSTTDTKSICGHVKLGGSPIVRKSARFTHDDEIIAAQKQAKRSEDKSPESRKQKATNSRRYRKPKPKLNINPKTIKLRAQLKAQKEKIN